MLPTESTARRINNMNENMNPNANELTHEELEMIAGGLTEEEWFNLTTEEREERRMKSLLALRKGQECTTVVDE